ncbi:MAG TPA: TIGR03435 family protein [Candidatus Sulfopaludibacter sp.]|nr:TIGR03435 family protein [Candidatus Sulfopaludibacter sp.]
MSAWSVSAAEAQESTPPADFEAASIKRSTATGEGASFDRRAGMLSIRNATLQACIREAYGVSDSQIVGQRWLKPDRYDIVAKMPSGISGTAAQHGMLQRLLAERFKLALHRETREMQVYRLVAAKNGPQIQPVEAAAGGIGTGSGKVNAQVIPMSRLAEFLGREQARLDHPVVDATGLSGLYTFTLEWTPDDRQNAGSPGTSIFAAIQEQLGLKLEAGKGQVEAIVVEHAETPTGN